MARPVSGPGRWCPQSTKPRGTEQRSSGMHEHLPDSPVEWTTLRELVARFAQDPDWLAAAAESITDAIHTEILSRDDLGLRPATRASALQAGARSTRPHRCRSATRDRQGAALRDEHRCWRSFAAPALRAPPTPSRVCCLVRRRRGRRRSHRPRARGDRVRARDAGQAHVGRAARFSSGRCLDRGVEPDRRRQRRSVDLDAEARHPGCRLVLRMTRHSFHIVAKRSQLACDRRRAHLVEQELHRFNAACPASQAAWASVASVSLTSIHSSISPGYAP